MVFPRYTDAQRRWLRGEDEEDHESEGKNKEDAMRWHLVFASQTPDLNGFHWKELVKYLGGGRWRFSSRYTDPAAPTEDNYECAMSTDELIKDFMEKDSIEESNENLGIRLTALKKVADKEGCATATDIIELLKRGEWPPPPEPPKITKVIGAGEMGFPPKGYRRARCYYVETDQGVHSLILPSTPEGLAVMYEGRGWSSTQYQIHVDEELQRFIKKRLAKG